MGSFEWTNDLVIRLMQEYQKRPELWDPRHEMYRVQTLKYESWRELANMFECDIADLRKKLNSLFASHRREKAKIRAGSGSTWFLYPYMNFLPTHIDVDSYDPVLVPAVTATKKNRPPIKEASPPAAYSTDSDDDDETNLEEDEVEYEPAPSEVVIKEEPLLQEQEQRPPRRPATHKPRLRVPAKRSRRFLTKEVVTSSSSSTPLEDRLNEALKLLRKADITRRKDECDSFGEYIASSLRKHDDRTQSMIKQAINNILFEQEMKKYGNQQYAVVIAGMDENPLILGEEGSMK